MTSNAEGKPEPELPGVEISKKLVLVNSASTVLTRLAAVAVALWMHQYLIRRIPTEEYAIYPVVVAVMGFTPIISSILTGGIARYVVEAYARRDVHRVSEIVTSMAPFLALATLVLWCVGGLGTYFIDSWLSVEPGIHSDAQLMLGLLLISQGLELLLFPFSLGLYVRQRFVLANVIVLCEELFRISMLMTLLIGVSPRVLWVVIATFVSRVLALLATFAISQRLVPSLRFKRRLFDGSTARRLMSFGGWTALGGLAYRIQLHGDPIVLNLLSTPLQVTVFTIGSLPARRLSLITTMASNPLQPAITAMHAQGDTERLKRVYLRGNRILLWMVSLPSVPLMVFGRPLAVLYVGDAYAVAGAVLLWVSLSFCIGQSAEMLYRVALAKARVRGFFVATIGTQMADLVLTLVLVGHYDMGAMGAAVASVIVTVVSMLLIFWPMGVRMVDISFARFFRETLWPVAVPAVVTAAVCWVLNRLVAPNTWLELGLCAASGGVAYLATLFLVSPHDDRRDLESLLQSVLERLSLRATD